MQIRIAETVKGQTFARGEDDSKDVISKRRGGASKRRKIERWFGAAGVLYRVYERGKKVFGRQEIRSGVKKSSGVRVEVQQR